MPDRPAPSTRGDYPAFRTLQTRWRDGDVYGHVNNVVHYELFDTVVNGWMLEHGVLDPKSGKTIGLVVESGCRYSGEILSPDTVTAGLKVTHVGRSSVRYEIGLFRNDDQATSAEGYFVHVCVDAESRRPVALPNDLRTALETLAT